MIENLNEKPRGVYRGVGNWGTPPPRIMNSKDYSLTPTTPQLPLSQNNPSLVLLTPFKNMCKDDYLHE